MKKFLLALAAVVLSASASAQLINYEGMPPYKLGITAGLNVPTFTAANCYYTVGLQAGIDLMVDGSDLLKNTFFRTQLKYSVKGATASETMEVLDLETGKAASYQGYHIYYTTHYIDLPIHYGYGWRIDNDWTITGETGPYLALGLGGTCRESGENWTQSQGFFHNKVSRFDYGWGVQAGVLYDQQIMLNLSYDFGFKNMAPHLLQNSWFSVGLTYYIDY